MSRTKSIAILLQRLPPDVTEVEARQSFIKVSAYHLRTMVEDGERRRGHWSKIRSSRPLKLVVATQEPQKKRPPSLVSAWRDIVSYANRLTRETLQEAPI